jgi:anti-sigma factor RsiW
MKMEFEAQLKLQAFLDGELPDAEARQMSERLAQDPEATGLLGELRLIRDVMHGFEESVKLPESREFYWSQIMRQLPKPDVGVAPVGRPADPLVWLRRVLLPATAVALLIFFAVLGPSKDSGFETATADSGAFTYHNFAAGTTLVWLSYPAENEAGDIGELDGLE